MTDQPAPEPDEPPSAEDIAQLRSEIVQLIPHGAVDTFDRLLTAARAYSSPEMVALREAAKRWTKAIDYQPDDDDDDACEAASDEQDEAYDALCDAATAVARSLKGEG